MLLGIYLQEFETYVHIEACTWMFTVALSIITRTFKQPRYTSVDEWI